MNSGRKQQVLVVLACLAVALPLAVQAGAAAGDVTISDVRVTPSAPAPGELVQFDVAVTNDGQQAFEIEAVALRTSDPFTELVRVEKLGQVASGETKSVPLTHTFEEAGRKQLRLVVFGDVGNEDVRRVYPLSLPVRERGPQLSVETSDFTEGVSSTVAVTVSNGGAEALSNVEVTLRGEGVDVEKNRRIRSGLGSGSSEAFEFAVTPTTDSDAWLEAVVRYTTAGGEDRTVTYREDLTVDALQEDVAVSTTQGTGPNPKLQVDVSNFGNAPLRNVVVVARADGEVITRTPLSDVTPGGAGTGTLDLAGTEGEVTIVARYETGGRSGTARTTVDYTRNPGDVELTGVDVERVDGKVHLSGSASNVGLGAVEGVVVRVLPSEGVEPARPYREFFVGQIPPSDFVSFDLYATVDANTSTVPVEVRYIVDGEERTEVARIPIEDSAAPQQPPPDSGSSGNDRVVYGVGALIAFAVLGLIGFAIYNSQQ
jgi:hypothetical protein